MFDVSLVELAVIALVALLVLGPERLPRAARTVGLYVRKARQSWYSVRADIERELAADELKRSMERNKEGIGASLGVDGLRDELRGVQDDLRGRPRISPPRPVTPAAEAASSDSTPPSNELPPEQAEPQDAAPAVLAPAGAATDATPTDHPPGSTPRTP